jgi:methionine aminopeptidase
VIFIALFSRGSFVENKAIGVMKPGHSFTIEPMISEGKCFIYVSDSISNILIYMYQTYLLTPYMADTHFHALAVEMTTKVVFTKRFSASF